MHAPNASALVIRSHVRAGTSSPQHPLKVRTQVRAGDSSPQHPLRVR